MLSRPKIEDAIDLWEVWIEYDQLNPTHFGTLYVLGEIITGAGPDLPQIRGKNDTSRNQLILDIAPGSPGRWRTKEVFYSEPIKDLNQYTSVCICSDGEIIAF